MMRGEDTAGGRRGPKHPGVAEQAVMGWEGSWQRRGLSRAGWRRWGPSLDGWRGGFHHQDLALAAQHMWGPGLAVPLN